MTLYAFVGKKKMTLNKKVKSLFGEFMFISNLLAFNSRELEEIFYLSNRKHTIKARSVLKASWPT